MHEPVFDEFTAPMDDASMVEPKRVDDDEMHDPDYQAFVESMVKFCSCEYDQPCDSVLAAGPCERKAREDLDHPDFSDW